VHAQHQQQNHQAADKHALFDTGHFSAPVISTQAVYKAAQPNRKKEGTIGA
jgi:hypothetical protein